ncbi:MAG: hypothetical protein ABSC94_14585 [Polyangiaceae bacterium]
MSSLIVIVDGARLPDGEARAFWQRFSRWMEEHVADLAGFAAAEGLASVRPEVHGALPALVASRSAAQSPYATAVKQPAGGPVAATANGDGRRPAARRRR